MRLRFHLAFAWLGLSIVAAGSPSCIRAQEALPAPLIGSALTLPDAPRPQGALEPSGPVSQQADSGQDQNPAPPAPAPGPSTTAQGSSSSQTPTTETSAQKTQREKAEEQMREEEKQRVLGVLPNFNISYRNDAVSLTAMQKIRLALHSAVDPVTFGTAAVVAGYGEAADSDSGFRWGAKGYAERAGAKYLDAFDGTMIGNGFLPALLHQDPRYFRMGHGSATHRLLYAAATTWVCKHDNSGKWEPNYSNVIGNVASGAISNLYYPSNDSGIGLTIGNGLIVTGEGTLGAIFDEFWPDISRRFFHRDPTHGLDAQMRDADKSARQPIQHSK